MAVKLEYKMNEWASTTLTTQSNMDKYRFLRAGHWYNSHRMHTVHDKSV